MGCVSIVLINNTQVVIKHLLHNRVQAEAQHTCTHGRVQSSLVTMERERERELTWVS